MRLVERFDRDEKTETLYDYAARRLETTDDIILSRIKGRSDSESLPTVLRVIGDVGTGEFDGFEALIAGEEQTSDEVFTIRALDLTKAGSHSILGRKLNLIELLPSGLKNVSAAISMGNFERVANVPAQEIARARDDAKNSVAIALHLYEANRWIYGDGAFGLRLAAWIEPLRLCRRLRTLRRWSDGKQDNEPIFARSAHARGSAGFRAREGSFLAVGDGDFDSREDRLHGAVAQ